MKTSLLVRQLVVDVPRQTVADVLFWTGAVLGALWKQCPAVSTHCGATSVPLQPPAETNTYPTESVKVEPLTIGELVLSTGSPESTPHAGSTADASSDKANA